MVVILGKGEMGFARIGIETQSGLDRCVSKVVARCGVVVTLKVDIAIHSGEEAPGEQELWVARDSFLEQTGGPRQFLSGWDISRGIGVKRAAAQVEVVGGKIFCRYFLDRGRFVRQDFCMQL